MADSTVITAVQGIEIPEDYDLSLDEWGELCELSRSEGIPKALAAAFDFGFIRGTQSKMAGD